MPNIIINVYIYKVGVLPDIESEVLARNVRLCLLYYRHYTNFLYFDL